jgi:hypothetical protein
MQPFQYNPATGELRYYPPIEVRLSFPSGSFGPATLQLFRADHEVAIQMVDDGDIDFQTGEDFLFYGQLYV